jgi:eukaryotic-like serine/threonine-protein kinase
MPYLARDLIGQICDEKYRIIRFLGQGGMGSVYEAEQLATGQRVALKCIEADLLARGKNSISRFQREAKALGAIDTEHIVRVLDAGADPETKAPYMVMELLDGEDLQHLLARVEKLEPDTALRIAAQICVGLQKAHEARVVHRDIKPANVFLARRGDGEIVVKILDFGIAKIKPEPSAQSGPTTGLTRSGGIVGSPAYMSPEQARGLSNIDYTTDLWSLGVVLYRCLSGTVPHDHLEAFGDMIIAICSQTPLPIQSLAPWVEPATAAVVRGALQVDIGDRFPTATAMLDAMRPLLPDGWSLREDQLGPVSEATRAAVAPKLPGVHSPDDAQVRLARITARVPDPLENATTARAPVTLRPRASVRHDAGSTTTGESSVTTGANNGAASRPARSNSDLRARSRWTAPAAVGLLAAAGFIVFRVATAPTQQVSPQIADASVSVADASTSVVDAPLLPALHRARLVVLPVDVVVEIDGKSAPIESGSVELEGALGSRHRVRLSKGKQERTDEVIMTDTGISPGKLELEMPKPRVVTQATTLPPVKPTPSPSVDPMIPDKFR